MLKVRHYQLYAQCQARDYPHILISTTASIPNLKESQVMIAASTTHSRCRVNYIVKG